MPVSTPSAYRYFGASTALDARLRGNDGCIPVPVSIPSANRCFGASTSLDSRLRGHDG
ncbi:hypothetical protein KDD30_23830 (plasmid) [Photobacterium sp. GJ3]|uniref:hypothetical protein n=1 Tax=Photobacterium sp. GJ3 TaxID=2829502 RepID=UPI001B8D0056|nr:hypothetical protein [Photobacterium sp. GJ3]QUJ69750.1 hypothetical protein KDD30_23830 [Photobacterium sp. GJ3]